MTTDRITTAEELNALPVGSVVVDLGPDRTEATAPLVACKGAPGDWQILGDDPERRWISATIARCAEESVLVCVYRPGDPR